MRVLVFAPFSGITDHAEQEWTLIRGLQRDGIETISVTCAGTFDSYCHVMSAVGITEDTARTLKKLICKSCIRDQKRLLNTCSNPHLNLHLGDFLSSEDYKCSQLLVSSATPESWADIEWEGIPVGRIASYELFLTYKLEDGDIPIELLPKYRRALTNTILSAVAASKVLNFYKPDRVLVYNGLYGVNRVWKVIAENFGSPAYSVHGGFGEFGRKTRLMMYRNELDQARLASSPEAVSAIRRPLSRNEIEKVVRDFKSEISIVSPHRYSAIESNLTVRMLTEELSLEPCKPVFLAVLSSEDERLAAKNAGIDIQTGQLVFKDQIEWITELIRIFSLNPNWQLVVRLHPRMFPNRRERTLSPSIQTFQNALSKLPANARVSPIEISIYDLLKICAVGLVRSSTVGLEMMMMGIPVVSTDPQQITGFPPSLALVAEDVNHYQELLEIALHDRDHTRRTVLASRYWFFRNFLASSPILDIPTDSVRTNFNQRAIATVNKYLTYMFGVENKLPSPVRNLIRCSTTWTRGYLRRQLAQRRYLAPAPISPFLQTLLNAEPSLRYFSHSSYLPESLVDPTKDEVAVVESELLQSRL